MTKQTATGMRVRWAAGLVACAAVAALAGAPPVRAQDVPFVPTPQDVVDDMLELAELREGDVVYDLGSGDGRIAITAAQERGVRAIGVDSDPQRIREGRQNAAQKGLSAKVQFRQADLFDANLKEATVVTLYLLPEVNRKLRPRLLEELRPGTRIVSHSFDMGDWEPDRTALAGAGEKQIYLWIVPARVGGSWSGELEVGGERQPFTLALDQKYQRVGGTIRFGDAEVPIRDAVLKGPELRFSIPRSDGTAMSVVARVDGQRLQGTVGGAAAGQIAGRRANGGR